jgi:ribosomal protein S19
MGGVFRIYNKSLHITEKDLNKKFLIYNGKDFQKLIISKNMIGYRFGQFTITRKVVPFKKK